MSSSGWTRSFVPRDVALISEAIKERGIAVTDVIKALAKRGFREEAENLLNVVKLRVSGDYLQTSAMIRNGRIISGALGGGWVGTSRRKDRSQKITRAVGRIALADVK